MISRDTFENLFPAIENDCERVYSIHQGFGDYLAIFL